MADCAMWLYRADNDIVPDDNVYVFCKTHDVLVEKVGLTYGVPEEDYVEHIKLAVERHKEKHGQGKQTEEQGT